MPSQIFPSALYRLLRTRFTVPGWLWILKFRSLSATSRRQFRTFSRFLGYPVAALQLGESVELRFPPQHGNYLRAERRWQECRQIPAVSGAIAVPMELKGRFAESGQTQWRQQ